jgi:hypothetical protein
MKKLSFVVALSATLLTGCIRKECWVCTTTNESFNGTNTAKASSESTVCDMSRKDVRRFEDDMTFKIYSYQNGDSLWTSQTVSCH